MNKTNVKNATGAIIICALLLLIASPYIDLNLNDETVTITNESPNKVDKYLGEEVILKVNPNTKMIKVNSGTAFEWHDMVGGFLVSTDSGFIELSSAMFINSLGQIEGCVLDEEYDVEISDYQVKISIIRSGVPNTYTWKYNEFAMYSSPNGAWGIHSVGYSVDTLYLHNFEELYSVSFQNNCIIGVHGYNIWINSNTNADTIEYHSTYDSQKNAYCISSGNTSTTVHSSTGETYIIEYIVPLHEQFIVKPNVALVYTNIFLISTIVFCVLLYCVGIIRKSEGN